MSETPENDDDSPHERRNVSTGSIKPALTFGFIAATVQMALLLWLLYC